MIRTEDFTFTSSLFSAGEIHIQLSDQYISQEVQLELIVNNSHDIMEYLLLSNALHNRGVRKAHVLLKYLPYARQDRVCAEGQADSLKLFMDLLNGAYVESFYTIWDAHNETSVNLDNCILIPQINVLRGAGLFDVRDYDYIISPDKGATEKTKLIADKFNLPVIKFNKDRDPKTGAITGMSTNNTATKGSKFLIVDDICDGGRTFIEIAKIVKDKFNPTRLDLYTTHGIYSKGLGVLAEYIDNTYCANRVQGVTKK